MKKIEAIKAALVEMEADMQKFLEGNRSACARVRKSAQVIKVNCNELRKEVQEMKVKNDAKKK